MSLSTIETEKTSFDKGNISSLICLGENTKYDRVSTFSFNTKVKKEVNDDGYLIQYDVPIARTGDFVYKAFEFAFVDNDAVDPNADVRVYRDHSSFTKQILEKNRDIPFTNDHPNGPVNVSNAASTVVGWVHDLYMKGNDLYAGRIVIHDQETIDAIENKGKKEVSIGFEAQYLLKPENINGKYYDGREKVLRINHLSLVSAGKAGPQFKMHHKQEEQKMSQKETIKRTVNGVELDVPAEKAIALSENESKNRLDSLESSVSGIADQINQLMEKLAAKNEEEKVSKEDKKQDESQDDDDSDKKDDSENKCSSKNSVEKEVVKKEETHAKLTSNSEDAPYTPRSVFQCNSASVLSPENIMNEDHTAVFAAFQNIYC